MMHACRKWFVFLIPILAAATASAGQPPAANGPFGVEFLQLLGHPTQPDLILATAADGFIYRSKDGGQSWQVHSESPGKPLLNPLRGLVRHPVDPQILYGGLGETTTPDDARGGVYRSMDGGVTWDLLNPEASGLEEAPVDTGIGRVVVAPSNPNVIYASSFGSSGSPTSPGLLYRSADAGQTWQQLNKTGSQSFPAPEGEYRTQASLTVHPSDAMTLFAYGYDRNAGRLELIKSSDGGETWQALRENLFAATEIRIFPSNPQIIVSYFFGFGGEPRGLFRSQDGGESFQDITPPDFPAINSIHIRLDPADPDRIYVLTEFFGLWMTEDTGQTWAAPSDAVDWKLAKIGDLLATQSGSVLAATLMGPYRFSPPGSWTFEGDGLPPLAVRRLIAHPADADTLFATTSNGLTRSQDGAQSWQPVGFSFNPLSASLVYAPEDPSLVLFGVDGQSFLSNNGGDDWESRTAFEDPCCASVQFDSMVADASHPGVLYVGGRKRFTSIPQAWRSDDFGTTWHNMSEGLEQFNEGGTPSRLQDLAIDPSDSQKILGATQSGAYLSTDGAQSWHRVEELGFEFFRNLAAAGAGEFLAVSISGSGVFKSVDGGENWSTANSGLGGTNVQSIFGSGSLLFASRDNDGLWMSRNAGETWHSADEPLAGRFPLTGAVSPADPDRIYVATVEGVIRFPAPDELQYRLHFAQFGDGETAAGPIRSEIQLVNLREDQAASATVEIRDEAGQAITVDLNGQPVEGSQEFTVPAGGLLSLATDGLGTLQVGSVRVTSDQPLSGVILFESPAGFAGVGSSQEIREAFLSAVETDSDRGLDTGFSIQNVEDREVDLTLWLADAFRNPLARTAITLPPRGKLARFIGEFEWAAVGGGGAGTSPPDFAIPPDFLGRLEVVSDGRIAATAIQTLPGEFATLPVQSIFAAFVNFDETLSKRTAFQSPPSTIAPLAAMNERFRAQATPQLPWNLYFPQFADGQDASGSINSRLYLLDPSPGSSVGPTVSFMVRNIVGLPLEVDLNGIEVAGQAALSVPDGGLALFETDGQGPLVTGSAQVSSSAALSGVLLLSGPVGSAGVGAGFPMDNGFSAPMRNHAASQTRTGIAIVNLDSENMAEVELELRDADGNVAATGTLSMAPNGREALFLDQIALEPFDIDLSDFRGVLLARVSGRLAATVIITRPGQFATLPVAPLPSTPNKTASTG